MKKISIVFFLLTISLAFSLNTTFQYLYGYDFSKSSSSTFMGIKANIILEKETDNAYFRLSADLIKLSEKLPEELEPLNKLRVSFPWMLYFIKEAYADIYFSNSTLTIGRFLLQNGSATLYSPSVLLAARNSLNPFDISNLFSVDGVKWSGALSSMGYDILWTPVSYDDFPESIVYPSQISNAIAAQTSNSLSSFFKDEQLSIEASIVQLTNQLEAYGLNDSQIFELLQNPQLLSNYGFTQEQISKIELGETLLTLPSTYTVKSTTFHFPNNDFLNVGNSNFSVDTTFNLFDWNFKLIYTHDHYHFMVPKSINLVYSKTGEATKDVILYRPIRNSLSIDFQGISSLFDSISYHGEASLIIPQNPYSNVACNYYVPDTNLPTQTTITSNSTRVEIFDKYYVKAVGGIEYTKNEDLIVGLEGFEGLPGEYIKNHISFGIDTYIKGKISDFSFKGLGLVAFSKVEDEYKPGYMMNVSIAYTGIDGFEPSLRLQYAYVKDVAHALYPYKKLNSVEISLKAYF